MHAIDQPLAPASERPRLVEDAVRRELLFGDDAHDLAAVHERRAVVDVGVDAHRHADADGDGQVARLVREPQELDPLRVDELAPLHQVLGRVAADDLLGERDEGRVIGGGLARPGDDAVDVGVERADRGVDVGDGDANEPHELASA